MRIFLTTDMHFSETSSIVRGPGRYKYTKRLENCIATQNWTERKAEELDCDMIIHLGDFFDKAHLTDQEITAVQDIQWSNIPHYFLVGNHESEESDLKYSSTKILEAFGHKIISEPIKMDLANCELCFLPYVVDAHRQTLNEYFGDKGSKVRVILSHNDIKGIQMGPAVLRFGFDKEDIENSCDLFLNGHLHNGMAISDTIINLGNITGKDMGEDFTRYTHNAAVLDTDEMSFEMIENPEAFNFGQFDITSELEFAYFDIIKDHSVLSIKCVQELLPRVRELLEQNDKVEDFRLTVLIPATEKTEEEIEELVMTSGDFLTQFATFCKSDMPNTDILEIELAEVCK
jgi:DNA repair exonuclease SbcCD nuclease subunit